MAQQMGIELLTEAQYRHLQTLCEFDLKTSSWVCTPPEVASVMRGADGWWCFNLADQTA